MGVAERMHIPYMYMYYEAKSGMAMHKNKKSGMANATPAISLLPPLGWPLLCGNIT